MVGKVIKPIPGTGYSIGDHARFDKPEFDELEKSGYLEKVNGPETATIKPAESSVIKPGKQKRNR